MALPPPTPGYGDGIYRRRIRLVGEEGRVRADLEDDFHRFALGLVHDGERVTRLEVEASRFPWQTCPEAARPLEALQGLALTPRCTEVARHTDPKRQCTHLFDLAGLAIAHAARGGDSLQYDLAIPDRIDDRTEPTLARDGEALLHWQVRGVKIESPEPFAGRVLVGGGFLRWATEALDPATVEPVFLLWRACAISMGRAFDIAGAPSADTYASLAGGNCYSFLPEVVARARRHGPDVRDFTDRPEALLTEDG